MRLLLAFPVLRVILPFVLGVISGAFVLDGHALGFHFLVALGAMSLILVMALVLAPKSSVGLPVHGFAAQAAAFFGGLTLVCSVSDQLYPDHLVHEDLSEERTWVFTVDGETQDKPRSLSVRGDIVDADGAAYGRVLLYLAKDSLMSPLRHGDRLMLRAPLSLVQPAGNPNEFNYARFLRFHHIHHQAYVPHGEWMFLKKGDWSPRRFFIEVRQQMLDVLRRAGLSGENFAVAAALVLGYKADLEQTLVQAYAGAGATHVLAVSGLHVGIIYLIINSLLSFLSKLKHGDRIRAGMTVGILVGYAFLTGLSPSVTRAVTMFSFVAVAKSLNRRGSIYNTLACSAIGLIMFDPLIVMQVGFQLSYAAVLGIVIFQPWLAKQATFENKWADKVWEITCVSVAAQISTFPLGLLYFHQFPNLFFVSNLFVIPAATFVLQLGLVAMVAQVWNPLLAFVGLPLRWTIEGMNWLVGLFNAMPYAVTNGIDISIAETLLIYAFIGTTGWMLIGRQVRMLFPSLVAVVLLAITQTWERVEHDTQQELTVYNIRKETAIALMDGTRLNFLASDELAANEQSLLFHVRHHWWAMGMAKETHIPLNDSTLNRSFRWGGLDMAVIAVPPVGQRVELSDRLDIAIIHGIRWKDIPDLAARMPGTVVLSAAMGERTRQRIREFVPPSCRVWDVANDGAYRLNPNEFTPSF